MLQQKISSARRNTLEVTLLLQQSRQTDAQHLGTNQCKLANNPGPLTKGPLGTRHIFIRDREEACRLFARAGPRQSGHSRRQIQRVSLFVCFILPLRGALLAISHAKAPKTKNCKLLTGRVTRHGRVDLIGQDFVTDIFFRFTFIFEKCLLFCCVYTAVASTHCCVAV